MTYTIKDHATNKQYQVESMVKVPLDTVWKSQRNWFSKNSKVTIEDENGNYKTFNK